MNKVIKTSNFEDYRIILDMMHIGLIDIRASERIEVCKAIADIFHNTPNAIARNVDPSEIYELMFRVAKRNGLEEYVAELQSHCQKKITKIKEIW